MFFSTIRKQLRNASAIVTSRKWLAVSIAVVAAAGLYILINAWLLPSIIFANSVPPRTTVAGVEVGGSDYDAAIEQLERELAAVTIAFTTDDNAYEATATELGLSINQARLRQQLEATSLLRPYSMTRSVTLPLTTNQQYLGATVGQFELKQHQPATNASFVVDDGELVVSDGKPGRGVDVQVLQQQIIKRLQIQLKGITQTLTFAPLEPMVSTKMIRQLEDQILKRTTQDYSLSDEDTTKDASDKQKSSWWHINPDKNRLVLDEARLKQWVGSTAQSFEREPTAQITSSYTSGAPSKVTTTGRNGRQLTNLEATTAEMLAAAAEVRSAKLTLEFKSLPFSKRNRTIDDTPRQRTISYQVVSRGSITSSLDQFAALAAQTLADSRGWGAAGYNFVRVSSGGSFTLTLASAKEVGNASSGCSMAWSCRVGRSVLINDDRWRGATTAWNNDGGNLRDYRHMVVNHEVGHFLGNGHRYCSGAGQSAPVMQQQSISLQGCRFNPWPTAAEIAANR